MKKLSILFIVSLAFIQYSCHNESERDNLYDPNAPKGEVIHGFEVPKDSTLPPKMVIAGQARSSAAGTPRQFPTKTNIHEVGTPKTVSVGFIKQCIPGENGYKPAIKLQAKDSSFEAGIPEVVIAKDAYNKDENSENFCSFKILQGLKSNNIRCIMQDHFGNIWFGTSGGGVTRYDGKSFTNYTVVQGLSNDVVLSIYEDKKFNLWFGTFGGVSKYDGRNFTNYNSSKGLSNDYVQCIAEDRKGNMWFGTYGGGVNKYDGSTFTKYSSEQGMSSDIVLSMLEDRNGDMWFGTDGGGVNKFNGKCFINYNSTFGLSNNTVTCMLQDKSGNIWLGTRGGGVNKFKGNSFTQITQTEGLSNDNVYDIKESKNGNLWFATNGGGVNKYDGKYFTYYTAQQGLTNDLVFSICEDRSGTLWFGTAGGGVSRYNGKTFTHYQGNYNRDVKSMLEDSDGNLWFGTSGAGLGKYDGQNFMQYTVDQGLTSDYINAIVQGKNGNLWLGTDGDGLMEFDGKTVKQYTTQQGLSSDAIQCISTDKSGNLWIGTDGGGVSKFDGKIFTNYAKQQGLSDDAVQCILEDKEGNLWIGTKEGGVNKFDGRNFTHYSTAQGLSNNNVRSILEDVNGNLWFGTEGGGVSKFDGKQLTRYTSMQGLTNDVIEAMLQDKNGNLWFGTRSGFNRMLISSQITGSKKANKVKSTGRSLFKSYVISDGFLGMTCNKNALLEDSHGNIWVGTTDRLTCYHPEGDVDEIAPNIQLTEVEIFDEKIPWNLIDQKKDTAYQLSNGVLLQNFSFSELSKWYNVPENLSLAYNNNFITFKYIGITPKYPDKVKYQFKLEGVDENWSPISDRAEEITYRNLADKTYTFKIKALNSEGYWSSEFNYKFTIRPPWWKTIWAYIAYFLVLVGGIAYLVRWRTAALLRQQKVLEHIVVERTAEVVHQKEEAEKQREIVVQKNREILDSITYAQRLQEAILPPLRIVRGYLHENFILYKPKDIVAGDFYWMVTNEEGWVMFAAADCTGHGVPGAMVSVVCSNALNRTVKEFGLVDPGLILDKVRELVIETFVFKDSFGQKSENSVSDGMDISLCSMDVKSGKLNWAGAYNPIWIVRDKTGELEEVKPDKQPIGKTDNPKPFKTHTIDLHPGDCFYIFTDGYADQFGGPKGKKFKTVQMKEMFKTIYKKPMEEQKLIVNQTIEKWKGDLEQVDDICMIGVRI